MTNVLAELCQWASTLPFWEQLAFEKIINGVDLKESDYDELLKCLLENENLATPIDTRSTVSFTRELQVDSNSAPIRLTKITNLQNVNALVSGQTLTFGPALTTIYGANGSGKSGYARVLGCAGFTRGDRDVLPDVEKPINEVMVLSADVELEIGESTKNLHYSVGDRCPELASFYVFDSTSVRVHLTQSNTLSFSPAGLSYLPKLADVTDKVRERLRIKIEERSQPPIFNIFFQGDSEVSNMISHLGVETNLDDLRRIKDLGEDEKKQITSLDIQIAQLKAQDISEQLTILDQKIDDLTRLTAKLGDIQSRLGAPVVENIQKAIETYRQCELAVQKVSIDQFKSEHFTQIGSDAWYKFIRAAKLLANLEHLSSEEYPLSDSKCLLCQQSISPEANDLLHRLWAFLKSDAQIKFTEAQESLKKIRNALEAFHIDFFDDQSVSYRHLLQHSPTTLENTKAFIQNFVQRHEQLSNSIITRANEVSLYLSPIDPTPAIQKTIEELKIEREHLKQQDPTNEILRLEQVLLNLKHRELLADHFSAIEQFVQDLQWAEAASRIGGNTRHITKKHNELFKELVTDCYIELFEQTLRNLGRPLKVKVTTKGRKGETYKQIVLGTDPSLSTERGTVDKVLSEGEKRAVALADFLTEVALDTTSNGIILDDPVTSLDLEWRSLLAQILIGEASHRQVIVFTHDMPFLYFLKEHAEKESLAIANHWIKRGGDDNKPGYVFLDNSPALERDYRKPTKARELCLRAKDVPAAEQEALLREGFAALRTTYEAFIIFELLNEVVLRFGERISFGRLKDIVWDQSIIEEVIEKCEALSRCIEGHLHSDAYCAEKPTCQMLLDEIAAFDAISQKLKDLKKNSKTK